MQGLFHPEGADNYLIGYLVLAIAFVFEGISFLQSLRQARREAKDIGRDVLEHVMITSDPTLRAVVFEDAAALIGLLLAGLAMLAHQLTGSAAADSIGSILVGILLGVVAFVLISRNRRFLIGEEVDDRVRTEVIRRLLEQPEVDRVTYLRLEVVGPRLVTVVGDVDVVGDAREHDVARMLRTLEARIDASPSVAGAILSLATPDQPSLEV